MEKCRVTTSRDKVYHIWMTSWGKWELILYCILLCSYVSLHWWVFLCPLYWGCELFFQAQRWSALASLCLPFHIDSPLCSVFRLYQWAFLSLGVYGEQWLEKTRQVECGGSQVSLCGVTTSWLWMSV